MFIAERRAPCSQEQAKRIGVRKNPSRMVTRGNQMQRGKVRGVEELGQCCFADTLVYLDLPLVKTLVCDQAADQGSVRQPGGLAENGHRPSATTQLNMYSWFPPERKIVTRIL